MYIHLYFFSFGYYHQYVLRKKERTVLRKTFENLYSRMHFNGDKMHDQKGKLTRLLHIH